MLVLTRKLNESILIGDSIEIKIVGIKGTGDQAVVRIGVVAPKEVSILRRELYDEVVAANREAAQSADPEPKVWQVLAPGNRPPGKKDL